MIIDWLSLIAIGFFSLTGLFQGMSKEFPSTLSWIIAIFASWAKLSYNKFLRFFASFYTTVVRGVPELLVIYLVFFGGSAAVMKIAKVFGYTGYNELNS